MCSSMLTYFGPCARRQVDVQPRENNPSLLKRSQVSPIIEKPSHLYVGQSRTDLERLGVAWRLDRCGRFARVEVRVRD